jgi:hypothetical protein
MQRHVKQTEAGAKLDGQPAEPFVERPEDDAAAVDEPSKPKREPRASSWLTALVALAAAVLLVVDRVPVAAVQDAMAKGEVEVVAMDQGQCSGFPGLAVERAGADRRRARRRLSHPRHAL